MIVALPGLFSYLFCNSFSKPIKEILISGMIGVEF